MNSSDHHPLLAGLNPEQREAASTREGPLLVLAGAGSGKTRLLTHRVAWLLDQDVPAWSILAVTFTNKAADEMKERVHALVGEDAKYLRVSTFHSFCVSVLRRDIHHLGWSNRFTIYDTDDQRRLLKRIMKGQGLSSSKWSPKKVLRRIDQAKNKMIGPAEYSQHFDSQAGDPTDRLFPLYEQHLKQANAVDFNDLINLTVRLWKREPQVLRRWQRRYRFLLIDEYQDTNRAQYELVKLLGDRPRGEPANVMVVGDDDQSIYAFRGADVRNILDFKQDFPDAKVVRLERNYRSTSTILDAANAVVRNNKGRMDKTLWTDRGEGQPIEVLVGRDEEGEANQVVKTMLELSKEGHNWRDMAVIYRTNAASRAFEGALADADIPHVLVGAVAFYARREVKDLVAYLKLVLNPADDMAFSRIINMPRRGIGAKTRERIANTAAQHGVPLLKGCEIWSKGKGRGRKSARRFVKLIGELHQSALSLPPGELVREAARESGYVEMLEGDADKEDARSRMANIEELARAVGRAVDKVDESPGAMPTLPPQPLDRPAPDSADDAAPTAAESAEDAPAHETPAEEAPAAKPSTEEPSTEEPLTEEPSTGASADDDSAEDGPRQLGLSLFDSPATPTADVVPAPPDPDAPDPAQPPSPEHDITAADPTAQLGEDHPLRRLQAFLDQASLASQADELPDRGDGRGRVTLLTAHLAKGLEFPVVFVAGMHQGGFPHFMAMDKEEELEEERRLVYVAFTRAEDRLFLTRPRRRFNPFKREYENTEPSRFMREIPRKLLQFRGLPGRSGGSRSQRMKRLGFSSSSSSSPRRRSSKGRSKGGNKGLVIPRNAPRAPWQKPRKKAKEPAPAPAPAPAGSYRTRTPESLDDLSPGTRVLHEQMGAGKILRRFGPPHNPKLTIRFESGPQRQLFARHANLEIIEG